MMLEARINIKERQITIDVPDIVPPRDGDRFWLHRILDEALSEFAHHPVPDVANSQ